MTPQRCIVPQHGEESGDCWRACIASILNLSARDVPNFVDLAERMKARNRAEDCAREWLSSYGLTIFQTYCTGDWSLENMLRVYGDINPGVPMILSGRCTTAPDDHHCVVIMNGKVVHDPSNAGVNAPCSDGYWWLEVIAVADSWKSR
jgi:hypothetical protein